MLNKSNSDRTNPNRRNSAFWGFFQAAKSEKLRFYKQNISLFFCYYCYILIKLINRSSSKNRTWRLVNINTAENRKNSDSTLLEQRGIAPAVRRNPTAITQGASRFIQLRGSGKAQNLQNARPSLQVYALPRCLV